MRWRGFPAQDAGVAGAADAAARHAANAGCLSAAVALAHVTALGRSDSDSACQRVAAARAVGHRRAPCAYPLGP